TVKCLLFFQRLHDKQNLITASKMVQVGLTDNLMKLHRASWNRQEPAYHFLVRKILFVLFVYMIPDFLCKLQIFFTDFHIRKGHCTFNKQVRNSLFPVGLSQQYGSYSSG